MMIIVLVFLLFYSSIAFSNFFPKSTRRQLFPKFSAEPERYLYYSPNFHRHVAIEKVGNATKILKSFLWLDEARLEYPQARLLPMAYSSDTIPKIAGGGLKEDAAYTRSSTWLPISKISVSRELLYQYKAVMEKLHASSVAVAGFSYLEQFPPLDRHWIRERIMFMLSPLPDDFSCEDWPLLFSKGFGAGLTVPRTIKAILALPQLLAVNPLDSTRRKPPMIYFYQQLKMQTEQLNAALVYLENWLTGASPSDIATFAYLHSLGVSWVQCRALLGAFSLSMISCDLDPNWELYNNGPVRKVLLEDSLLFLRMRLQLTPSEIFAMIYTHPRLSTYTMTRIKSHADAFDGLNREGLRPAVVAKLGLP